MRPDTWVCRLSHSEWTSRKIDPAGPSRFGSINSVQTWDMNKFRAAVDIKRGAPASTTSNVTSRPGPSGTDTYVIRPRDTWWTIAERTMGDPMKNWSVLADANGGQDSVLFAGAVLTIPGSGSKPAVAAKSVEFPGEAKLGTAGPVVLGWQKALIDRGVIADTSGNRDSDYGQGLERPLPIQLHPFKRRCRY